MQYLVPNCASSSPSSGDAVLMGVLLKQQDDANLPLLRYIARGSRSFFPILIGNIDTKFHETITIYHKHYINQVIIWYTASFYYFPLTVSNYQIDYIDFISGP